MLLRETILREKRPIARQILLAIRNFDEAFVSPSRSNIFMERSFVTNPTLLFFIPVNFDHFQILRAIGKGSFGKVRDETFNWNMVLCERYCYFVSLLV